VLAKVRRRGRFNFGLGSNGSLEGLTSAIKAATGGKVVPLGVYCLAGADIAVDDRRIAAAVEGLGLSRRSIVRNDTFAVLRAGTDRSWGVAVVCGTGMNCAGVGADGRFVRFPSFGELSGDKAHGGGWLGRSALGAAIRARDGRGGRTVLESTVPEHFGMSRPAALMEAIYVGRVQNERLSELAPVVLKAAAGGDEVAGQLMDQMVEEIVATANAAIRRLRLTKRDVHVVLGGGVLRAMDEDLIARITKGIREVAPEAVIMQLAAPPVLGAALIGLDELRAPDAARTRVRKALSARARPRRPESRARLKR
jgi:N-acetylglucosamine kinase-like BadF-type ATPase